MTMATLGGLASAATVGYVVQALQLAPALIRAGLELKELAEQVVTVVKKDGGPTDEDLQKLADQRALIRKKLEDAGRDPDVPTL